MFLSLWSDEHRGDNGIAKICIDYEHEVQQSQRRPANLLDALERGDRLSGGDAAVGEVALCEAQICSYENQVTGINVSFSPVSHVIHTAYTGVRAAVVA